MSSLQQALFTIMCSFNHMTKSWVMGMTYASFKRSSIFTKTFKAFTYALCLSMPLSAPFISADAHAASTKKAVNYPVKVCAVPQLFKGILAIQSESELKFETKFYSSTELYALLSNAADTTKLCDVVLSSDQVLPLKLIRSNKAMANRLIPFAKAPLVLWSRDPQLIHGKNLSAILQNPKLKSLAIANPSLTPVGYATHQLVKMLNIATGRFKEHLYKTDHEYQVYSMVANGNVSAGFISKPLIADPKGKVIGSYYQIPDDAYHAIEYYAVLMEQSNHNDKAQRLMVILQENKRVQELLKLHGFETL